MGKISNRPFVPLLWFVADELWGQWVRNHSAPIDWCAKEVGGHPFRAAWGCWDGTGVDIVTTGFGCFCTVLMFVWCGLDA